MKTKTISPNGRMRSAAAGRVPPRVTPYPGSVALSRYAVKSKHVVAGMGHLVCRGGGAGGRASGGGVVAGAGQQVGDDAGGGVGEGGCDTRSHVVSELVEEVWLMPGT